MTEHPDDIDPESWRERGRLGETYGELLARAHANITAAVERSNGRVSGVYVIATVEMPPREEHEDDEERDYGATRLVTDWLPGMSHAHRLGMTIWAADNERAVE